MNERTTLADAYDCPLRRVGTLVWAENIPFEPLETISPEQMRVYADACSRLSVNMRLSYVEVISNRTWVSGRSLLHAMQHHGIDFEEEDDSVCWKEIRELPYEEKLELPVRSAFLEPGRVLPAFEEEITAIGSLSGTQMTQLLSIRHVGKGFLGELVTNLANIGIGFDPATGRLWNSDTAQVAQKRA